MSYSVRAFSVIGTVVSVLAKHKANMLSCIVTPTVWKSVRGKKVEPNVLAKCFA